MTTSDQIDLEELRSSTRRVLDDKVVRRAGWDGEARRDAELDATGSEQGWFILTVPEELGGLGQNFEAIRPIYEELGRSLAPIWLSGTMAALDALLTDGGEAEHRIIAAIAKGDARVALAILPEGAASSKLVLPMVPADTGVTHFLLLGSYGGEGRLVAADAPGVNARPVETWDRGRSYVELALDGTEEGLPLSAEAAARARAHGEIALALDCVGAASQCLADTVEYMLGRQQFGRAIATFQALKHRAADHKVAIEMARALAGHAARAFAERVGDWRLLATQSCVLATAAFRQVAEDAVQLHGGVGFTWEYDCHLFLKRALVNELLHGAPEELQNRIGSRGAG